MKEMLDQKRTSSVYDDADVDLVVEVFRDMLVVAILPGYKRDFKKYNLQMLAGAEGADEEKERPAPVKLSDLIAMKKLKEQGLYVEEKKVEETQAKVEGQEKEESDDDDDGEVYKAKIDILDEIEKDKAQDKESSSDGEGP